MPHDVVRSSLPLLPMNIGAWSWDTAASFIVFVFLAGVGVGRNSAKPSDELDLINIGLPQRMTRYFAPIKIAEA